MIIYCEKSRFMNKFWTIDSFLKLKKKKKNIIQKILHFWVLMYEVFNLYNNYKIVCTLLIEWI